jgi:MFS superfamily sulfate permease-like transporter
MDTEDRKMIQTIIEDAFDELDDDAIMEIRDLISECGARCIRLEILGHTDVKNDLLRKLNYDLYNVFYDADVFTDDTFAKLIEKYNEPKVIRAIGEEIILSS